jgi:hypothetical protein
MRTLSGFLFCCGAVLLYFGLGMFLFSGEADALTAVLVKSGLVSIGALSLGAGGWLWFRAKQSDLSSLEPEKASGQSRQQIRRSLRNHILAFSSAGFLIVIVFILWILNR